MTDNDKKVDFKDLPDSEKAEQMREKASSMREFGSKGDYYSHKEAIDDCKKEMERQHDKN